MKQLTRLLLPSPILICFATLFVCNAFAEIPNCYVVSVYDGDSFVAVYKAKLIRCRLAMVDAPELKQSFGINARDSLAAMILGKTGSLTVVGEDKYHRQLRLVVNNKDVAESMLANGFAWLYNKDDLLKDLELAAQSSNAGLWGCKRRIAPWQYRRLSKTAKTMFSRCDNG